MAHSEMVVETVSVYTSKKHRRQRCILMMIPMKLIISTHQEIGSLFHPNRTAVTIAEGCLTVALVLRLSCLSTLVKVGRELVKWVPSSPVFCQPSYLAKLSWKPEEEGSWDIVVCFFRPTFKLGMEGLQGEQKIPSSQICYRENSFSVSTKMSLKLLTCLFS